MKCCAGENLASCPGTNLATGMCWTMEINSYRADAARSPCVIKERLSYGSYALLFVCVVKYT